MISNRTTPPAAIGRDILLDERPPDQRLDAFIDSLARAYFEDPVFARLSLRGLLDGADQRKAHLARTAIDAVLAPLARLIAALSDAVDPDLTAASILSLVAGHYLFASIFVHLPRELCALSEVDACCAHIQDLVRRSLGLPRRLEAAP